MAAWQGPPQKANKTWGGESLKDVACQDTLFV
jgi:hypothetical protein